MVWTIVTSINEFWKVPILESLQPPAVVRGGFFDSRAVYDANERQLPP